ncbi:hypothetical protein [Salinicoccus albus]|uniref:hypothetical protein n=1 Tax=Salinicoccus albus TaxID=418756 RepID=UPI000381D944|nr:hypothetical protein [Salinicoccus albus]
MIKPILTVEKQSMLNYLRSLSDSKKLMYVIVALIVAVIVTPAAVSILSMLTVAVAPSDMDALIFLVSVAGVVILSLIALKGIIKEMFMDRNIDLYLTFPISPAQLFLAKFFKQWLIYAASVMIPVSLVMGISLSIRFGSWWLIVTNLVYFTTLSFLVVGISYFLVFTLTRILPAKKLAEVLSFLGGTSFILIYLFLFWGGSSLDQILTYLPEFGWLYDGFLYSITPAAGGMGTGGSLLVSAVIILGLKSFVTLGFKSGWAGKNFPNKERKSSKISVSSAVSMLIFKDLKLTLRDFKEWMVLMPQYLLPGVMIFIVYTSPMMAGAGDQALFYNAQMIGISITGTIIISLHAGAFNTARDAGHFSFLKMLPVTPKSIVKAKYLYNILTITPGYIAAALAAYIILPIEPVILLYSVLFIMLISLAVIPAGMYIGSREPVVSRKNPTNRLDAASSIVITIIIMLLIFAAGFVSLLFIGDADGINHTLVNIVAGVCALGILLAFRLLKIVVRRYTDGFKIIYKD